MDLSRRPSRRAMAFQLFLLVAITFVVAAASGRLSAHHVADTPSYLNYPLDSLERALKSIRTPLYPMFLVAIKSTIGLALVPVVQWLLHVLAAWSLGIELQRWGARATASLAAALAIALGCTAMDNASTIATDAPAAACGVITAVLLMRWVRLGSTCCSGAWRRGAAVVLFAVATIMMRPAYLALIPWVFVAGVVLTRFYDRSFGSPDEHSAIRQAVLRSFSLSAVAACLIIGWMGLRGIVVGDFGMLPFGHQNLSGLTVQLASDEELLELEGDAGKFAAEVIRQRDHRIEKGFQFTQGDPSATMTIEGRWNDLIYQAVIPAAINLHGNDPIVNHRAIGELNKSILSRYPLRYLRWLLLGARRAVWAVASDILMNPVFLVGICAATAWESWRLLSGASTRFAEGRERQDTAKKGVSAIFLLAWTYFVINVGFVILSSPPLGRFSDAAAIFIPAWIAAALVEHFADKNAAVAV